MKVKTADLTGPALDWAVAKCEGKTLHYFVDDPFKKDPWLAVNGEADQPLHSFHPSTDWGQGGRRIEQEGITLLYCEGEYVAGTNPECFDGQVFMYHKQYGLTPLIAAMRCYVASKLGDTIEVPEELQ